MWNSKYIICGSNLKWIILCTLKRYFMFKKTFRHLTFVHKLSDVYIYCSRVNSFQLWIQFSCWTNGASFCGLNLNFYNQNRFLFLLARFWRCQAQICFILPSDIPKESKYLKKKKDPANSSYVEMTTHKPTHSHKTLKYT